MFFVGEHLANFTGCIKHQDSLEELIGHEGRQHLRVNGGRREFLLSLTVILGKIGHGIGNP